MKPLVSVIIPTYNRANTVARTINCVLSQTYDHFEIIVVDDGSTDNTVSILKQFSDNRIKIVFHDVNKGVTAAKNTGLDNIKGEWFTILDSDDEIVPEALETLMKIPLEFDTSVDAVTCNCIDTSTNSFGGSGMDTDQYVDFKTMMNVKGEFWGVIKTTLLLNDRFNPLLAGFEATLWYKIDEKAKRYYIHKALRIFHTEGDDRVSNYSRTGTKISRHFQVLSSETHYLNNMKKYLPDTFAKNCLNAVIYLVIDKKKDYARFYYQQLKTLSNYRLYKVVSYLVINTNSFIVASGVRLMVKFKIL